MYVYTCIPYKCSMNYSFSNFQNLSLIFLLSSPGGCFKHVHTLKSPQQFILISTIIFLNISSYTLLSQWDFFPMGNLGRFPQGKPAATVMLPNLNSL